MTNIVMNSGVDVEVSLIRVHGLPGSPKNWRRCWGKNLFFQPSGLETGS